jgi:hypothetical protein
MIDFLSLYWIALNVVVLMNIPLKIDLLAMVKNEKIYKIYITNK